MVREIKFRGKSTRMRKKNLVVRFDEKDACFIVGDSLALSNVLEIISNIHDYPKLLEETK